MEKHTSIPAELKALPNWIVWKFEERQNKDGSRHRTKVPYDARDKLGNTKAKSNDPATWTTFDDAVAALDLPIFSGIGFCFPLDRSIYGVDFDAANEKTHRIIERLNTYIERSPSGNGYHAIARNGQALSIVSQKWPEAEYGCNMEVYNNNARYFTMTGDAVKALPVADLTADLRAIIAELESGKGKGGWEEAAGANLNHARNAIRKCLPTHVENDGSQRLLDWCRQCVKAGLSAAQSVSLIREEEQVSPFPRYYSDAEIEKRLTDTERRCGIVQSPDAQAPLQTSELVVTDWDTVHGDVEWLWEGKIPYEGCTLIAGEAGISKSTVTLALAAACSTAGPLPDGQKAPLGDTILFTAEDADKVVKSRLVRLGADLKRIHKVEGRRIGTKEKFFDLKDLVTLEKALEKWPETKLIIIDPVASYVEGVDTHKNSDVRGVLKPLTQLCAKHKLAVLLVCHLNKDTSKAAGDRITGSSAWRDLARAAWFVVKDKEIEDKRYLLPDKNNNGPLGNGFVYELKDGTIEWRGETTAKLHELMKYVASATKTSQAEDWLKTRLGSGKVLQTDVEKDATAAGFTTFTVRQAKDKLGVKAKPREFRGPWIWYLPENETMKDDTMEDSGSPF